MDDVKSEQGQSRPGLIQAGKILKNNFYYYQQWHLGNVASGASLTRNNESYQNKKDEDYIDRKNINIKN